jgi:AhpD family alkylhydroperoxidase
MALEQTKKELAAMGASIGAGCRPCIEHHVGAAREAGLSDDEIAGASRRRKPSAGSRLSCSPRALTSCLAIPAPTLPQPMQAASQELRDWPPSARVSAATPTRCSRAMYKLRSRVV